jgi:uncharacterized protein (TIGR02266 family)
MNDATARKPEDDRMADRVNRQIEVTGNSEHQFFTGFSENISAGGLFVATYQTKPIGSKFKISFSIPGIEHVFDSEVEVRWTREYNEDQPQTMPGMGVRFLSLTSRESEVLTELVQRIDTIFFDD